MMRIEHRAIDAFLRDPAAYFGHSLARIGTLPREELDALQLAGVRRRFERFRHTIPMLEPDAW